MELTIVNVQYDFMRLYLFRVSAKRKFDQQKLFNQMIITAEKVAREYVRQHKVIIENKLRLNFVLMSILILNDSPIEIERKKVTFTESC